MSPSEILSGLRALLRHMIDKGLSNEEKQRGIFFAEDLEQIKAILNG